MQNGIYAAKEWVEMSNDAETAYTRQGINRLVVAEAALRYIDMELPEAERLIECAAFIDCAMRDLKAGYQYWACEQAGIPPYDVVGYHFEAGDGENGIRIYRALIELEDGEEEKRLQTDSEWRALTEADALEKCRQYWHWKEDGNIHPIDVFEVEWLTEAVSQRYTIGVTAWMDRAVNEFRLGNQSWAQAAIRLIADGLKTHRWYVPTSAVPRWGGKRNGVGRKS